MSRTAEDDGADGSEHGETTDVLPDEEPEPAANEETDEAAAADSESDSDSESRPEPDPAALRCGITLGEQ